MKSFALGGAPLSIGLYEKLVSGRVPVALAPTARHRMLSTRQVVERAATSDEPIYGLNTGFGKLARVRISSRDLAELQLNLIRSHACGVGEPLGDLDVRGLILLRAHTLALGYSGVRPELVDRLLALFNEGIHPRIPSQGSVGASGDLAPLAHLALVLIGEGRFRDRNGSTAARRARLSPLKLEPKEGLSLINGTQFMTALGANAALEIRKLVDLADIVGAVSLEALMGTDRTFAQKLHELRPHSGQAAAAHNLRALLSHSANIASHRGCDRVQDAYSLRCMPQVHGAVRDALTHAERVLTTEMNSVTDNPIVFGETKEILSCGHFHGEPVALVLDYLGMATAELASISERRIEQLVNPSLSGLPAFLATQPGLQSGFMMAQVTASSLVSENKVHAHPASVDSIPTSANQEDHVSMGSISAMKLKRIVENTRRVLAIELLAAAQGLDLKLAQLRPGRGVIAAYALLRDQIPVYRENRPLSDLIGDAERIMTSAAFLRGVRMAARRGAWASETGS